LNRFAKKIAANYKILSNQPKDIISQLN